MGTLARSVAYVLSFITAFQPLVSSATVLRYNYAYGWGITQTDPGEGTPDEWVSAPTVYGDWTNVGNLYGCSNWSPSTSSQGKGITFTQTATDCDQDQERLAQARKKNKTTGEVVDNGAPFTEHRTTDATDTREAVGILENWSAIAPTYTEWLNTNTFYGCLSWSPSPSMYQETISFTQTASCKTDQERTRQDREQEQNTGDIRDSGDPIKENQTLNGQLASRNYAVTVSDWVDVGAKNSCTNWSPDPATIDLDVEFTQTATDCIQPQSRTRNEAYTDHKTGGVVSLPQTTETQELTDQTDERTSKGTKISLAVNVTGASASFVDSPFTLNWSGNGMTGYSVRSNNAGAGLPTSDVSVGTTTSTTITPTAVGTHTYTVTAINSFNETLSADKSVTVEALPSLTGLKVNGGQSITVAPGATLSFAPTGISTGSTLQGRSEDNSTSASLPLKSSATAGVTTYYAAAVKTVNNVTKTSAAKSVQVTVVDAPSITSFTAPSSAFAGSNINLAWTTKNATTYTVRGSDAASGISTTDVAVTTSSIGISPTAAGNFTYILTATNAAGVQTTSSVGVQVENDPVISSFTSNASSVASGSNALLSWTTSTPTSLSIDQSIGAVTGTSKSVNVGSVAGQKTYSLTISRTLNGETRTANKSVDVLVVAAPTVAIDTAPATNVFVNSPFTLGWTGTDIVNSSIAGNVAASGVSTTPIALGAAKTRTITPTAAGTYTYTVTATNSVGTTTTATKTIIVEALPVVTSLTSNPTTVTAGQDITLSWVATGTSMSIDQSVGPVTGSSKVVSAGSVTGIKTYTLTTSTTLNGVTKTASKSVAITVVAAPTVAISAAPSTNVFVGNPFTLGWTGTGITNYSIAGSAFSSGVETTGTSLGTSTTASITPTAPGTYTYTITATNSVGTESTAIKTVTVEAAPTVTSFTSSATSATTGQNVTLSWVADGSTMSIDQSVGTVTGTSKVVAVGTVTGPKTYTLTTSKTLNGVTLTATKSVSVNVVAAPTVSINTAPSTNVFVNTPFSLGWTGSGVTDYSIAGNVATSGVSTTPASVGTSTTQTITPTAAGTYTYTITAKNSVGTTSVATKVITVEDLPAVATLTASAPSVTAGQNVTLSWSATGVTLSIDQSVGTVTGTSKVVAVGATVGTKTYTLTASTTLNGVTKAATKSVAVTVVAAPTVAINDAPSTNVFVNSPFILGWTGTGVTQYTITGNNAASGIATTAVDLATATSRTITPTAAGTYTYTLSATNSVGAISTATRTVVVEALPVVSTFIANPSSVTAGQNTALSWASTGTSISIDQSVGAVTGTSVNVPVGTVTGAKTYTLTASTTLNGITKTATKAVTVTVVAAPMVTINTAPTTNVFVGSPFTLGWTGTGVTQYTIAGNNSASGIATTPVDLASSTTRTITPTAAGSYTYTITATNSLGAVNTATQTVIVEALPVVSAFTASPASVTAGQSTTLTWASTGVSFSIDQSVGPVTGTNAIVPVGAVTGAKTYTLTASTTLNGVTKTASKSVTVTVVAAPTVAINSAPATNVFVNNPFTLGWSGTGATKYSIKGSAAASGVATTEVDLASATSYAITPTAAGTYTYTITATNSLGEVSTDTVTIVAEALPVVSTFTATPTSVTAGQNVTLAWASTGVSLSIDQAVGTITGTSIATPVGTTAGAKIYTLTASTTLNGVTKTASKSVTVTVIAAPTVSINTAPSTNVFISSPFTLGWAGTGATKYTIKGNTAASGVATTAIDLATATSYAVTPTAAGTYTYTITATNSLGAVSTDTVTIVAEALPVVSTLTATPTSVTAGQNVTLTWASTGVSFSIDQSIGAVTGTSVATPVGTTPGAKTYTLTASTTLNGVTKTASKSVTVTVVAAPTVAINSAPATNVFVSSPFTLGWSGTGATKYSIKGSTAASGVATTAVDLATATSYSITPTAAGSYTYTITATNSLGAISTDTITIVAEALPVVSTFTATPTSVTAGQNVTLAWASTGVSFNIDQSVGAVTGTSVATPVGTTAGAKIYTLTASTTLNGVTKTASKSVTVTVVAAPTVSFNTAPSTNVFVSSPFTLGWAGTGVTKYTIKGNTAASGVATTAVDLATATSYDITPTAAGTYTYTITATNALGAVSTDTQTVVVEALPVVSTFTASPASVTAGQNVTLTWASTGVTFSIDQSVGAVTGNSAVIPVGTVTGAKTYTLTASNTLNGVTKIATKSVVVTVVAAPVVSINIAPSTNVFIGSPFTLGWTGTGVTKYTITGSAAASGIATTAVDLATATSRSITPTAAGTYTYTITATNALGAVSTDTQTVIVEALPVVSTMTATPTSVTAGQNVTLAWASTGVSLSIDQSVGAVTGTSVATPVGTTAGAKTYTLTASTTLNGVTKTATKAVAITVVAAPTVSINSAPTTNVFIGLPFTLGWTGTGATKYSIKGNTAASGVATTAVDLAAATSYAVTPTAAGTYTYTITATNSLGAISTDTVTIIAEALPVVSTLTATPTSVTAGQNVTLNWVSTGDDLSIDQSVGVVTGTSTAIPVGSVTGAKTYTLTASTTLNGVTKTATKSVAITIVAAPTVTIDTAPSTNVFINSPFTLGWTGTGVTKYTITGNSAASGIATTPVDLGVTTSRVITPTAAGTYTYTVTATNSLGAIITDTQTVIVEALPVVSALTASPTSVTAGQNVTLTWASTGASLSIDQSVGTVTGTSLAVPVGTVTGAKTYVMTATTTLNGVTKTASKSVAITIVAAPTVSISTAPATNVFVGSPFTLGWTGTGATSYSIKGSNAASGVAITDTSLAMATTTDITPTGAGTFTYTITAINSLGAKVTATKTVIVEAAPSISTFTITPASLVAAGTNATLAWTTSAVTSLAIDQGVGTVTGTSKSVAVGAVAGAKAYTLTLTRTLNGVTKTATKSASVTVVLAPTVNITATPATNVYVGSPFTLSWSGTDIASYSIVSDAAGSGIATTAVSLGTTATQTITPTAAGSYTYTVTATNSVGVTSTASDTIVVEDAPTITSLTATPTSVTANTSVALAWVTTGSPSLSIDQGVGAVTGTTTSVNVGTTTGSKTYTLTGTKVLNGITKTATKSVAVTVVAAPTVSIGIAPATNVFSGSAFTLGWTGTGVTSYTITGSAAASGVATTPVAMGTTTTRSITPTAAGTYTYTVTAVNSLGASITDTQSVTVEAAPSVTTLTATPASVATGANTTLAWVTSTPTSLSVDQSVGTVTGTSKAVAVGTTAGVKTYTLTISRTLNGITKTATKAVNVTVVAAPTVTINSTPSTNVFVNTPFSLGWTGTDVTSYSIKGSAAASGETTANTALGTATSRSITPTAAGTYTYTITATNAVGVTATATQQIIVEALPTLTAFTANPATVNIGGSTTLSWTQTNATSMTIDQGVGAVTGSSKAVAVGSTAGVKTFSMTVSKVLNGVTKSATLSVPVTVENWVATTPVYGAWTNVSAITGCTAWAPSPSNYTTATQFTQTGTGCNVTQNRTRQDRQVESATGTIRNVGSVVTESQNVGASTTREYLMDFTVWANFGGYYGCSAWSPDASTVTIGTVFTQAAYCTITQQRGAAGYTWGTSSWVSDPAVPLRSESRAVGNQYVTQTATGTKETWAATTPTYTAWVNSSGLYSCGAYSPDPSAYTVPTQFTQTAYCYVNQSRTRQDRQYETTTGAIRNVGAPVAESQTLGSQPAYRTYLMDFNAWGWAGDYYACSGWSPDPSTVNSGVAFTQTAYCYRNQQRGAAGYIYNGGWVPDPAVPYRVETVAYSGQPIYNTAYGTKPTTVCRWDANNYYSETYFQHNDLYNYKWVWDGATISTSFNTPGGYSKGAKMTATQWQICRL